MRIFILNWKNMREFSMLPLLNEFPNIFFFGKKRKFYFLGVSPLYVHNIYVQKNVKKRRDHPSFCQCIGEYIIFVYDFIKATWYFLYIMEFMYKHAEILFQNCIQCFFLNYFCNKLKTFRWMRQGFNKI